MGTDGGIASHALTCAMPMPEPRIVILPGRKGKERHAKGCLTKLVRKQRADKLLVFRSAKLNVDVGHGCGFSPAYLGHWGTGRLIPLPSLQHESRADRKKIVALSTTSTAEHNVSIITNYMIQKRQPLCFC